MRLLSDVRNRRTMLLVTGFVLENVFGGRKGGNKAKGEMGGKKPGQLQMTADG